MKDDIKITVLMPVFNAERTIAEAVGSVLEQRIDSFELLIINDGSTDDSLSVVSRFSDPRIRVISQENKGISEALNRGLAAASGKYIARFDADDICLPERLRLQAEFLDRSPDHFICGSDAVYITEEGHHLFDFTCAGHEHGEIMRHLFTHCPVIHSAAMYRKDIVLAAGGYPLHAHSFEDHLLWVQLKDRGLFHNIPRPLVKIRFSEASYTIDERWRGKAFRRLKQEILRKGTATEAEGKRLLAMIRKQENGRIKKAAYYALCGKKWLINNPQPAAARKYLRKAIAMRPFRPDNYLIYVLSFFPANVINWLYRKMNKKENK